MVLAYDHDNHLTEVHGAIDKLATYEYDALARRIVMVDWSNSPNLPLYTIRQYIYSGQNVVEEYDGDQDRACYYVHGPSYIDERVLMYDEASEADYVYLLKDLYTVAGLADAWGWLVEAYDYDAYGKVTMRRCAVLPDAADYDADGDVDDDDLAVFAAHENGPGNDPCDVTDPSVIPGWRSDFDGDGDVDGSDYIVFAHAYGGAGVSPRGARMLLSGPMPASRVSNPYFFTGRRLDLLDLDDANTPNHFTDDTARLPLYHYRARAMDPVVGRFFQRDSSGYQDGMDLYEYVGAQVTTRVDPSGFDWINDWILDPILKPISGEWLLRCTGGERHVPILDPGVGHSITVTTCEVIACVAPVAGVLRAITLGKKGLCAAKNGCIARRVIRIRHYIRRDPVAHHGKPPGHWDLPWLKKWRKPPKRKTRHIP